MTDNSSVLSEADPKSLDMFFSMDPLQMSDTDISVIVEELRRQRAQWAENEARAIASGTIPKRGTAQKVQTKTSAAVVSLEDLSALILGD